MSNLILIPENLLAAQKISVTVDSEASSSMAGTNLLTESPAEFWRSTGNAQSQTSFRFQRGTDAQAMKAKAIALVGHNFTRGDQVRVVLTNSSASYSNFLAPTAIVASNNRTGAVTVIDEGQVGGGDFMTPTTGTNWDVHLSFPTPSATLSVGADLQSVRAQIKVEALFPTTVATATVRCDLYESGALVANLGTKVINSATVQDYVWPWDASLLAATSGANVEIKLTFEGNGNASYAPKLDSVVIACDVTTDSVNTADIYSTSWETYAPFAGSDILRVPEIAGQGNAWLIDFGATYTFAVAYVFVRSDRSPIDIDTSLETPPTQHGYVQIGCVILGETWSPTADRDFGPLVSTKDYSSKSRTYGGQHFGSRRFIQRILFLPLNWLTPAEAHSLFDRILWRHGILKPILVSILPGDATEETHTTFLASLRNPETAMVATTTRGKSRGMTLEFEEEL